MRSRCSCGARRARAADFGRLLPVCCPERRASCRRADSVMVVACG
jgi:hypothetical protein